MDKDILLKIAKSVREDGITTNTTKGLLKKASDMRIVSLLAAINK